MKNSVSHEWSIGDPSTMAQIFACKPGESISSAAFALHEFQWKIKLFPNGQDDSDKDSFQMCLHLLSRNPASFYGSYVRILCRETQSCYTTILCDTNGQKIEWPVHCMSRSELQELSRKQVSIVIEIGRPSQHKYLTLASFHTHQQWSFKWQLEWNTAYLLREAHCGKRFESPIYDNLFCLRGTVCKDDTLSIELQLCSALDEATSLSLQITFECTELSICIKKRTSLTAGAHVCAIATETMDRIRECGSNTFSFACTVRVCPSQSKPPIALHPPVTRNHHSNSNSSCNNSTSNQHNAITHKLPQPKSQLEPVPIDYKAAFFALIERLIDRQPKHSQYQTGRVHQLQQICFQNIDDGEYRLNYDKEYECYSQDILAFLNQNGTSYGESGDMVDFDKIKICVHGRKRFVAQTRVLEIYYIKQHARIPSLERERGLRARQYIAKGTVLGEYFGVEYLEHEYDAIYNNTPVLHHKNAYGMTACVEVRIASALVPYFCINRDVAAQRIKPEHDCRNMVQKSSLSRDTRTSITSGDDKSNMKHLKRSRNDIDEDSNSNNGEQSRRKKMKLNNGNGLHCKVGKTEMDDDDDEDSENGCGDGELSGNAEEEKRDDSSVFDMDIDDNNTEVLQKFRIVIDGLGPKEDERSLLIYMNDAKKYLYFTEPTAQDQQHRNVELITVLVNNWPRVFGVAIKSIKQGEELFADYGDTYVAVQQQKMLFEHGQYFMAKGISTICDKYGIDLRNKR